MPRRIYFVTLLTFLFLFGEGVAQQLVSPTFGQSFADAGSSGTAVPAPGNEPRLTQADEPSHLVRPAVHQTPDRAVRSVQRTDYPSASEESGSGQDRNSVAEAGPAAEPPGGKPSAPTPNRDLGFPALAPPGDSQMGGTGTVPVAQGLGSVVTVASSLAIVLGLFFVTAWLMRRTGSAGLTSLPNDVFEVLGRAPLNHRQQVHLLRCGTKLLLVSLTPDSAETLTEIDDPDEVTRLAGLCRATHAGSATAAFRQVLHQFAGQPAEPGFIGRSHPRTTRAGLAQESEDFHG